MNCGWKPFLTQVTGVSKMCSTIITCHIPPCILRYVPATFLSIYLSGVIWKRLSICYVRYFSNCSGSWYSSIFSKFFPSFNFIDSKSCFSCFAFSYCDGVRIRGEGVVVVSYLDTWRMPIYYQHIQNTPPFFKLLLSQQVRVLGGGVLHLEGLSLRCGGLNFGDDATRVSNEPL